MPIPMGGSGAITPATCTNGVLTTQYTDASNSAFVGRVAVAMATVAEQVIEEDQTYYNANFPAGNGQHAARVKFAFLVKANPVAYAEQGFVFGVVADLATNNSSTDDDILARVLVEWNFFAAQYQ